MIMCKWIRTLEAGFEMLCEIVNEITSESRNETIQTTGPQ